MSKIYSITIMFGNIFANKHGMDKYKIGAKYLKICKICGKKPVRRPFRHYCSWECRYEGDRVDRARLKGKKYIPFSKPQKIRRSYTISEPVDHASNIGQAKFKGKLIPVPQGYELRWGSNHRKRILVRLIGNGEKVCEWCHSRPVDYLISRKFCSVTCRNKHNTYNNKILSREYRKKKGDEYRKYIREYMRSRRGYLGKEGKRERVREYLAQDGMKKCRSCDIIKSVRKYYKSKNTYDGYGNWCKDCHTAHYLSMREYCRKKGAEWRKKNKERMREYFFQYYHSTRYDAFRQIRKEYPDFYNAVQHKSNMKRKKRSK